MMDPFSHVQTASEAMRPLLIVCILYIVLDVFFVSLRFISRFIIRRSEIGWDDWLILPAFICNVAACAAGLLVAYFESIGDRPAQFPTTELAPTLKLIFAAQQLVIFGFTFPKLSILTLYLRIFTGRKTRISTCLIMALVLAMGCAYSVASVLICLPVRYFWDRTVVNGQCMNLNLFYRSISLPQILIDAAILITPLPAIWGLQASVLRRLGVTLIFLTGVIGMVVSCIRWVMYARADVYILAPNIDASLMYINIIECSTYLIAACLPASYPAFNAFIPASVRVRFQGLSTKPLARTPGRPTPSPGLGRLNDMNLENKSHVRMSFSKLVDSPVRAYSPVGRLSLSRPESPHIKRLGRQSKDQSTYQNSPRLTIGERDEDTLSMTTHGRSQSRAETVRKEDDDEIAMAELRRLASEHRVPILSGGEDGGLIAVHTEIEVIQEGRRDKEVEV